MTTDTLQGKRVPVAVNFTSEDIIVTLSDGTKVSNPLSWHGWLVAADDTQRSTYHLYAHSIYWSELDEGLDIEGMLRGIKPKSPTPVTE